MSGRSIRNLRRWHVRLAGGVLSVLSALGPSMSAWAMDGRLLPHHPRVAEAQLVVPVPRATPEALARPAQAPVVASPRDTVAPTSDIASPRDTAALTSVVASSRDTAAQTSIVASPRDTVAQTSAEPALPFDSLVQRAAQVASVDAALLHAIIDTESGYDPQAVSVRGAIGLMQVLPRTGERFGVRRLEDPAENVRAGASYIRWLLSRFDDDLMLALAAYNAGEGAVLRYGRQIPPFPETQNYVRKVMAGYTRLREANSAPVVSAPPMRPGETTRRIRPVPSGQPTQSVQSTQSTDPMQSVQTVQTTRPTQSMQSTQSTQPMHPMQPAAVLVDTNHDTRSSGRTRPASERGDGASDAAATARAWRLLRGVGALLTRSPSAEAAGDHGRDRPAVVMPARGQERSAGPAIGG